MDPMANAIEIHISANLEKVFAWFVKQCPITLRRVFKSKLTQWEVRAVVTQVSLTNQTLQVTCQSEVVEGASGFRVPAWQ